MCGTTGEELPGRGEGRPSDTIEPCNPMRPRRTSCGLALCCSKRFAGAFGVGRDEMRPLESGSHPFGLIGSVARYGRRLDGEAILTGLLGARPACHKRLLAGPPKLNIIAIRTWLLD